MGQVQDIGQTEGIDALCWPKQSADCSWLETLILELTRGRTMMLFKQTQGYMIRFELTNLNKSNQALLVP